jgi:superfamily I DNA/RNA helicase
VAAEPVRRDGAFLVVGPAGSGKTTYLRQRFLDLVRSGERGILMLVHSRRAARKLAEEILRELGSSTDQVRVTTWHAYGLSLLRSYYRRLGYKREPALLTGPEQFTLVREMLDDPAERAHWSGFQKQLHLAGFVEELREFVLRAQDALKSPEQLESDAREAARPDLEESARFFRRYLDKLDARDDAVVDHANVIARAWQLLIENPDIRDEIRADTKHLLIDDYQDVTPAQHALMRELFVTGGSITAAADPGARIYGFRGSLTDSTATFTNDFKGTETLELTTVHRGNPVKDAWVFDHLTEEAAAIARECRRLRAREGIGWGSIAIIVRRYGGSSRAIRRGLEHAGVPYVVVGENRPLASEPVLIPLLELARAALRPAEREERISKLLASPVCGLDPYDARALRREAHIRQTSLNDLVLDPPTDLPDRLTEPLRRLRALMDDIAERNQRDRPDEVFWFLWGELPYLRRAVAAEDQDALDAVTAFSQAIERFSDRRPGKQFDDYLQVLEGVEFGPEPWNVPEDRRPDAVRLMTAHNAAGSEFAAAIVAGCVEGEFPDPRDTHAMLDLRDLLEPASPFERQKARLEEERRLFDVAVSRASRRLLLTAARESSQREALTPSPLIGHLGLEWVSPTRQRNRSRGTKQKRSRARPSATRRALTRSGRARAISSPSCPASSRTRGGTSARGPIPGSRSRRTTSARATRASRRTTTARCNTSIRSSSVSTPRRATRCSSGRGFTTSSTGVRAARSKRPRKRCWRRSKSTGILRCSPALRSSIEGSSTVKTCCVAGSGKTAPSTRSRARSPSNSRSTARSCGAGSTASCDWAAAASA